MHLSEKIASYFTKTLNDSWASYCENNNAVLFDSAAVVIIDSIAKAIVVDAHRLSNKDRFKQCISQYCEWPDANRICCLELKKKIKNCTCVECDTIRDIASQYIQAIGNESSISIEPEQVSINVGACANQPSNLLDLCRHSSIVYNIRNNVVHEGKVGGQGHDDEAESPYYYHVVNSYVHPAERYIRLYHPPRFFRKIASSAIDQFLLITKAKEIDLGKVFKYDEYIWKV